MSDRVDNDGHGATSPLTPSTGLTISAILIGAFALSSCGGRPPPAANGAASPSESLPDYYIRQKAGAAIGKIPPETRARLLEDLKGLQAAAARGENSLTPEVENAIELSRLEILAHSAAESAGVYATPTDAELGDVYQQYVQTLPIVEYHAAHILVATDILASGVIGELDRGVPFAKVANNRSADDSKTNGGDLGWIHPGRLPPEFFEVLKTLKPGEYSRQPIHTSYGWHVLKLLDTRAAEPPPLEQVKAQLAVNLQQERYQRFLVESAKDNKN